jgi:hypothetical protein
MGNRTPNLNIPIPYPRSANIDELFDWERFLHDAFIVVDTAVGGINNIITQLNNSFGSINTAITNLNNAITEIRNSDILLTSRIRIAGFRPLSTLLSELDNEGGGLLYFPAGTYPINSTLIVPANVRLMGNNAVLRPTESFYDSGDVPMFSVAGRGVVFEGLVFDGHTTNNDVRVSAIATNGNETTVVRCQFLRMGYSAIDHRSTTKDGVLRIRDSKFEDCWGDCILTNLSLDANSVVFTHPTFAISTVASYRGYGVGIKAFTQAGQTLRMVLQNVEFDRLLRTAILLTANPAHPPYEVRINKVKVQEVGLTRFSNPSGEASAFGNDESLYGALIYVKGGGEGNEQDVGTVHITDFDVVEPYGFVVRFPANNEKRHYLNKGRYKHEASGWSGSNPFNPISLRLARAFITDVEGYAFKRHFTKQSDAYGSYDTVFQNCRFSGVGDFGGTASDNIWYINCTFSGTAPSPYGRWFIGCSGAQFYGDKVIASQGGHSASSTLHLGDFQSGLCFKTTANYGLRPQIKANGRLQGASVLGRIFIPSTAFWVAEDEYNNPSTSVSQSLQLHPTAYSEIVATFNDDNRPSQNGYHRRLITTMAFPKNFYIPPPNDSDYAIKIRVYLSSTNGRLNIIPIRIQMWIWKPTEPQQDGVYERPFSPLTNQPNPINRVQMFEFIIPPFEENTSLRNLSSQDATLTIDIARAFVSVETDKVMLHGVELIYPALL